MVKDQQSSIDDIKWTVYGKISDIHKTTGTATTIHYKYDGSGNRISKTVNGVLTWYVRDATGNVMSIYTRGDNSVNTGHLTQIETDIYGSSRLGIDEIKKDMEEAGTTDNGVLFNFQRGEKVYELGNHLGNVLSTIGDAKLPGSSNGNEVVDYTPKVQSAGDYYPFGMQEPGRTFSNMGYRYGFNGKENDNEVKGEGDQQDYGFRIYDPRLVRFLSEDPITQKYPELTPYQFASNSPIAGVDEDGLEWAYYDKDNKQVNINNSTTKEDKLKISGVRWSGYDVDAKGNKTAKAGTVATAFTFGKEGVTVSYLNSKGEGVQGWVGYKDLSTGNKNTDTKIGTLHPLVQNDMKSFVLMSKIRFGIDLRVTDGFRTVEQQDKLYAQGRTTKGNIVTKARGGFSNHNFGLAVDVVPYENGNLNWNTKYYPLIGLIGEGRGLEWGHRWKKIDDKPHFQNLQGQTLKQLRALPKNEKGLPIIQ
ncbi:hypothetical protein DCM91_15000 [Chitinophaga costaii]|nr:hypothetical protein DCM91_15000 [Chitinophaga costaii]